MMATKVDTQKVYAMKVIRKDILLTREGTPTHPHSPTLTHTDTHTYR